MYQSYALSLAVIDGAGMGKVGADVIFRQTHVGSTYAIVSCQVLEKFQRAFIGCHECIDMF
jgi:hypothetical protein